jgi:hypothetical protein
MLEDIGDYYRIRLRSLEIQGRKMIAAISVNMRSTDKMIVRALEFASQIPGKPEIPSLSYSKTGFSNTRFLNISWKKVPKATAYYVYIAESPLQPVNPTLTEKNDSCRVEVREKRKQYVWVQATNSNGGSPLSEMAISNPNY